MILVKLGQIKSIFLITHLKRVLNKQKRENFPFQLILYQRDGHLHLQDLEQYSHSH